MSETKAEWDNNRLVHQLRSQIAALEERLRAAEAALAGAERYGRSCDGVMQAQQGDLNRLHEILADHKAQLAASESARLAEFIKANVNHEQAVAYRLCVEEAGSNQFHLREWIQENKAARQAAEGRAALADEPLMTAIYEAGVFIDNGYTTCRLCGAKTYSRQPKEEHQGGCVLIEVADWLARYDALSSPAPAARDGGAEA